MAWTLLRAMIMYTILSLALLTMFITYMILLWLNAMVAAGLPLNPFENFQNTLPGSGNAIFR